MSTILSNHSDTVQPYEQFGMTVTSKTTSLVGQTVGQALQGDKPPRQEVESDLYVFKLQI